MKKLILLLSALLIGAYTHAQNNAIQIKSVKKELNQHLKKDKAAKTKFKLNDLSKIGKVPGNQIHFEWNNNAWEFYYNSEITYHADGRKMLEMQSDQSNTVVSRVNHTYDASNRPIEISSELKAGNTWVPYIMTVIDYNTEGDIILYEDKFYSSGSWQIMNGLRYDISYNNMTETKTIVNSYFNGTKYDTSEMYIEYRNNNILIMEETHLYSANMGFVPVDQYTYLFDNSGVDTGMIKRIWDGSNWNEDLLYCNYKWDNPSKDFLTENNIYTKVGNTWVIYQRETYTRDNFGSFMYLSEYNYNGNWVGDIRIANMLDQYGSRVAYIYDLYTNGQWFELFRISEDYIYDNEGNILEHIYKESDSNGELQNLYKDNYSNYLVTTWVPIIRNESLKFYPNPATKYIQLVNDFEYEVYTIRNLRGQIIRMGKVNEENKIYVDELENGIYIVTINNFIAKFMKK